MLIRLLLVFLVAINLLSGTETYTFEELRLGNIVVDPLSSTTKTAYFSSKIEGEATINITIYHNGSLIITVKINNVKEKIKGKSIVIQTNLTQNNTITITATNYGQDRATIYGNSTIRICQAKDKNPSYNESSIWLKASFIMSIAIPPLIILIIRRRFRFEEEEEREIVVV